MGLFLSVGDDPYRLCRESCAGISARGVCAATVRRAKEEFGIRVFLVWHTIFGYWAGTDGEGLPDHAVRDVARSFGPGILNYDPK